MAKDLSHVLIEPIITEKSTALSQHGKYTFKVLKDATKFQIKEAFTKVFPKLKVLDIQTLKIKGHSKRTKKGYKLAIDSKKAIITVEGGTIEYFPQAS